MRQRRLRLQDRHPRLDELRAARRLHLQRRRRQRPRDPRRHRPLLRVAGLERHLQPAGLQPADRRRRFANDGRADFISNPTNGVTGDDFFSGAAKAPAQSPRVIVDDFKSPYTWQSSIGFQKQINSVTGFDADLTHYNEYRDTRTIDPNLFYDPATGYNRNPAQPDVRTRRTARCSRSPPTASATRRSSRPALNRRLQEPASRRAHLHADVRDARRRRRRLHDARREQPVRLSRRRVRDVRRLPAQHACASGRCTSCRGASRRASPTSYGSGNRFNASISATPYGKTGTNRLNLANTGGAGGDDHDPGGDARSLDRPGVDHVGHGDPAQRARRGCRCTRSICG